MIKQFATLSLLGLACATFAHANTITFTAGDSSKGATAVFGTSANTLSIQLTSLANNPTSAGEEVSGITFTLSTAPTTDTLSSVSGSLIKVSGSTYTSAGAETLSNTHWATSRTGANICLETAGPCAQSGKPVDLIIGTAASYPNANSSIDVHDPEIQGSGNFTLTLTGITAGTTISNVVFNFGTSPDSTLVGTPVAPATTPEPSSLALLGTGVLSVAGLLRRRLS